MAAFNGIAADLGFMILSKIGCVNVALAEARASVVPYYLCLSNAGNSKRLPGLA